ncbi:MAG: phosphotransferase [Ilumatobacter sp.]
MVAFDPSFYITDGDSIVRTILGADAHRVRHTRVRQIDARPGKSVTVQYSVSLADHERPTSLVVRSAAEPTAGLDPIATDDDGHPVFAFESLDDPALPGLRRAMDPEQVAPMLQSLGLQTSPGDLRLKLRAYRPLRRAVVEASGSSGRVFMKVVRPHRVDALHRRHRLLTDARVPVAPSVGYSADGIVVLGEITGSTLRQEIDGGSSLPSIREVHRLLDRFPAEVADLRGPMPPIHRVREHADVLQLVLPRSEPRLNELLRRLEPFAAARKATAPPLVPVHGDLYEAQIMSSNGRVRALVDVDGIGGGHRIDDDANALGHLSLYDLISTHHRARRLGASWIGELDRRETHDWRTLRAHVAAVLVGLATGSYRVQEPNWEQNTLARLDLALEWASATRPIVEPRPLRRPSTHVRAEPRTRSLALWSGRAGR